MSCCSRIKEEPLSQDCVLWCPMGSWCTKVGFLASFLQTKSWTNTIKNKNTYCFCLYYNLFIICLVWLMYSVTCQMQRAISMIHPACFNINKKSLLLYTIIYTILYILFKLQNNITFVLLLLLLLSLFSLNFPFKLLRFFGNVSRMPWVVCSNFDCTAASPQIFMRFITFYYSATSSFIFILHLSWWMSIELDWCKRQMNVTCLFKQRT